MKKTKLLSIALSALLIAPQALSVHADYNIVPIEQSEYYQHELSMLDSYQEADEELFNAFSDFYDRMDFDNRKLVSVYLADSTPTYSKYYYVYKNPDHVTIRLGDTDPETVKELLTPLGLDEKEIYWVAQNDGTTTVYINFKYVYNHQFNCDRALKAVMLLKEKYEVTSATGIFDYRGVSDPLEIYWSHMTTTNSDVSPNWEGVNTELEEKGLKAHYDLYNNYVLVYDDDITETEKFAVADYFADFGYKPSISIDNMTADYFQATDLLALLDEMQGTALQGDANSDGKISLADVVTVMQYIANPEKYPMTEQGIANADVYNTGDGITAMDALEIQRLDTIN